jgi:acyl-coenzyme A thioesterase PaaI-like protein
MAASDGGALVDTINGAMEYTIPIAHRMGVKILEAGHGRAAASVPMEGNSNHFGVMYAGVLFTAAEILGGIVAIATFDRTRYFPLVKNLDIKFVGMAKSEVRAEVTLDEETVRRVESEADANGKSDFIVDAVVTDADGQVVATTRGLYQLRAQAR